MRSLILAILALSLHAAPSQAAAPLGAPPLPLGRAQAEGFSDEGLARIDRFYEGEVAAARIPGAVVAIARNGKLIHFKAYGQLDTANRVPMPLNAIFPLASMTKIMTSVAAMTLNENGHLRLQAPLSAYFPEFTGQKVAVKLPNGETRLDPAVRPISIHDLFRHTAGLGYRGLAGYPDPTKDNADAYLSKIAGQPLIAQPGSMFDYGAGTDVLGLVVEKVARASLGPFMKTVLWDKVGMPDTRFTVPQKDLGRRAFPLPVDPITGKPQPMNIYDSPNLFDVAGSGALGTVGDYVRFGQMLLNGGVLDGVRVLSPKTVAYMTSNHLSPSMQNNVAQVDNFREGYGFGLGVAVRIEEGTAAVPGSLGDYTWNGGAGTLFWNDPQERLVVVVGMVAPGAIRRQLREQTSAMVYGAMTQSYPPRR
ncbi:MAG: serine hydrolase domain-containing protein [Pseudomonadota bacterium]